MQPAMCPDVLRLWPWPVREMILRLTWFGLTRVTEVGRQGGIEPHQCGSPLPAAVGDRRMALN